MSKKKRREKNIHLTRSERFEIRDEILSRHGDCCHWCGKPMDIPENGVVMGTPDNMATIEHHYAIQAGTPDCRELLVLCHKKCNK